MHTIPSASLPISREAGKKFCNNAAKFNNVYDTHYYRGKLGNNVIVDILSPIRIVMYDVVIVHHDHTVITSCKHNVLIVAGYVS